MGGWTHSYRGGGRGAPPCGDMSPRITRPCTCSALLPSRHDCVLAFEIAGHLGTNSRRRPTYIGASGGVPEGDARPSDKNWEVAAPVKKTIATLLHVSTKTIGNGVT